MDPELKEQMAEISRKLDRLPGIDERLKDGDERFGRLEDKLGQVEKKLDRVEAHSIRLDNNTTLALRAAQTFLKKEATDRQILETLQEVEEALEEGEPKGSDEVTKPGNNIP